LLFLKGAMNTFLQWPIYYSTLLYCLVNYWNKKRPPKTSTMACFANQIVSRKRFILQRCLGQQEYLNTNIH